ncbi:MAG: thymidylate kinase, partial [Deltaproteobacteria bacterium]|nr:thymidylate kinase [Deltaproteobacteria bacterium]
GRGATDRIEREPLAFHERVRQGYLRLARKEPERVRIVDARQDIETVFHEVTALIRSAIHVADDSRT